MNPDDTKMESLKSHWYVWLFPIIALLISAWLLVRYISNQGPVIKILFDDASSIQADKTHVRFRGVSIGKIKKISISDDAKDVIAEVQLQSDAESFAQEGAKFWVVTAKVNLREVTGLETFMGGTYIAALPGKADGAEQTEFKSLVNSDVTEVYENTTAYYLETPDAESVNVGDVLTFRGLEVGLVRKVTLAKGAQTVVVQIQIQNKYVKLIRTNTLFWHKVGVQAKLGLFNSEIKVNSLDSILHGGIELFTPEGPGPIAKALTRFKLLKAPPKDHEKWNPRLE